MSIFAIQHMLSIKHKPGIHSITPLFLPLFKIQDMRKGKAVETGTLKKNSIPFFLIQ